jgi:mycothiol S-conjugate amidase
MRSNAAGSVLRVTEERQQLSLLQVHAHPDDEASKGAGTTAKYAAEGVHNVLVCCTGGEAGDILNPAVENPGSPEAMYELRMAELAESVRVLGYASLHMLGYRDSGMPDSEDNARPDNFANAPLDEAVGRLVKIIREEKPQVIITYRDDRDFYPHPDHIRVHEISVPAFDLAGDPEAYPDAGEPWQPLKLYYVSWSIARVKALHQAYLDRGEESVYTTWFERGFDTNRTDEFTTLIDVGDYLAKRRGALLAHRTQVDPKGHWMRLPDDVIREVFPWEEYTLARSLVENHVPEGEFEDDLFAGVRERVQR